MYSLAACPRERLVAIGYGGSEENFRVLQVKLPGDQHSRRSKRSGFLLKKQSYNTMISTEPTERFNQSQYNFQEKNLKSKLISRTMFEKRDS